MTTPSHSNASVMGEQLEAKPFCDLCGESISLSPKDRVNAGHLTFFEPNPRNRADCYWLISHARCGNQCGEAWIPLSKLSTLREALNEMSDLLAESDVLDEPQGVHSWRHAMDRLYGASWEKRQ